MNSSDKHKNTLEKSLGEMHVPAEIELNILDNFMSRMLAQDAITFLEEDFPEMGRDHNNAHFINIKCRGKRITKVLIDGGTKVNIIPLIVAVELGINT